tara:strand:+ start:8940 stop:10241 length:1302 start_codon:yes stop_codon:yes gene_type:complete
MSMKDNNFIYESPDGGNTVYKRAFGDHISKRELVNQEKFSWPLMKDCITEKDKSAMIEFIKTAGRFTNGPKVKEFESEWSSWLGCKYSLFVSSGSTANTLLVAGIKEKYNLEVGDKVVVPCMTWVTNVSPIIQAGLTPIFCDVDPRTFSFDTTNLEKISNEHDNIKAVFVSHLFGISADIDAYRKILPDAVFIEDVCESYGASYKGKKCGTLVEGSTFSFYFGHHMTTVEGGFVCTDDKDLYNIMKMKRSHGMAREALPEMFEKYKKENPDVHPSFMFMTDGHNLRSMEINAVLGISQLKNLDANNSVRRKNFNRFITMVEKYPKFFHANYQVEGNCSFCLPFVCKNSKIKEKLESFLQTSGVETRPLCSGNLLRQPFLRNMKEMPSADQYPHVEFLHESGFFIGNNHLITDQEFLTLECLVKEWVDTESRGE